MKKSLLILSAVILLAAACSKQSVQIQPAQNQPTQTKPADEMATWKTYTDNNIGFEFKYPSNWQTSASGNSLNLSDYNLMDPQYERGNPNGTKIQFVFLKYASGELPQTVYEKGISEVNQPFIKTVESDNNIIYNAKQPNDGICYRIIFDKHSSNKICVFAWGIKTDVDQILATSKFINPASQTSDWKSYTNSQYGFELQLPSNWQVDSQYENVVSFNSPENLANINDAKKRN